MGKGNYIHIQTKQQSLERHFTFEGLELSFKSLEVLVESWLFFIENFPCSVRFWCMLGGGHNIT